MGPRGGNSAPTTSSAWSVPRRSPCSTPGAAKPVPGSSQRRGLSCSPLRSTGRMPGSSSTLGLSGSGIRSIPGVSSVSSSLNNFPLEDMNIATAVVVPVTRSQARAVAVL